MKRQLLFAGLMLVAFAFAGARPAAAQDCGYGGGYGGGYWDGGYGWMYNTLRYEVPHFAAFPPVYYSYPVPRTYGYSPFAYPPYIMTPEVAIEPEPVTIHNPYVPSTKPAAPGERADKTAAVTPSPEPLVIINPFVSQNRTVARNER
jgi:hypothetical protein